MTKYEYNKQFFAHQTLEGEDLMTAYRNLKDFIDKQKNADYFMLLNNDLRYYTIFERNCYKDVWARRCADELLDIAKELGTIRGLELASDGQAFEVWITDKETDETDCYFFFDYTRGVIQVDE